jgi:DNA repair protein RadC
MFDLTDSEKRAVKKALKILETKASYSALFFTNPQVVKDYLQLHLRLEESEQFVALFLTSQHELIARETLFTGTIDAASVYPREVIKRALYHNAASVIFAHNHPSGICDPSQADRIITDNLKAALEMVGIRTLDHIIIGQESYSFAEHGLLRD